MRNGALSVVATLPTGTGKGTLEAHTAVRIANKGHRIVITAPREEIARDLFKRVQKAGGDPGFIAPWAPYEPEKRIHIAMAPTLANRWRSIEPPDVVIIDECHHAPADGYRAFLDGWPNAKRIGFTATLWRLDGQGFQDLFDAHVDGPPVSWFVEQGYLTDVGVYAPFEPDLRGVASRCGDYEQSALEQALERSRLFGNAAEAFHRFITDPKTAVAFCCSKKHADLACGAFMESGIVSNTLLGEDQGDARRSKIAALDAAEVRATCSVDVVSEGFDLPSIDAAVLMRPTKSKALYLQQVGRALRPVYADGFDLNTKDGRLAAIAAGPKPRAIVLDLAGNWHRHGHPLDDRTWRLEGEDKTERSRTHTEDGECLSTRRCDACLQVYRTPATACPFCGTEHGTDPRVPACVAAELRLVERMAKEEEDKAASQAVSRQRYHAAMMREMKKKGVPNPRYGAFHRLIARAMKAVQDRDFYAAIAIGKDLAEEGFKDHEKMEALRVALRAEMEAVRREDEERNAVAEDVA